MYKKKIVVFHKALAPYRIDFFNQLSQNFNTSIYFFLDNLKDQKFDQERLRKEIQFEFNLLKSNFEYKDRSFHSGIFKILKKENADIVLCSEYGQVTLSVLVYKYLFNRKLRVYTLSDDSIRMSEARRNFRRWIRNLVSFVIDGVIFPSEIVCNWYREQINSHTKTFELPIIHSNNIFREKLSALLNNSDELAVKHKLIGKKVFLFTGRLVKLKNIDFLLKSFSLMSDPNKMLIIIGNGEESENLKKLVLEYRLNYHCLFTGRLEGNELLLWYNIAQCLVLPSYKEAYGAVVNESLLAGCKVLCSNYAGASVLINETNGYTFDPFDTEELTCLLNKISGEISPLKLPLILRPDGMPFTLEEKTKKLFPQL